MTLNETMTERQPQTESQSGQSVTSLRNDERVIEILNPLIEGLGYELVHVELQTHRAKTLRVFIDRKDSSGVGIEDCVRVTKALDEPLEAPNDIDAIFPAGYELEVSSPGVDRPLRKPSDYEKFKGREIRVHVFRPLTADELDNTDYREKNPKQKNFLGTLEGLSGNKIRLAFNPADQEKKKKKTAPAPLIQRVSIPLSLISKANLEPNWEIL